VVGIVLALVLGVAFGLLSVALGMRIPFLTLAIGYIIGNAVVKTSRNTGMVEAMTACICTLAATGIGLFIMYMQGIPMWYGIVVAVITSSYAFRIGAAG
jgi:hypothetical protein